MIAVFGAACQVGECSGRSLMCNQTTKNLLELTTSSGIVLSTFVVLYTHIWQHSQQDQKNRVSQPKIMGFTISHSQ